MAVVPVVAMKELHANLGNLEIRVCKYACPDTGRWVEYVQVRRPRQAWGEAALLDVAS